MSRRRIRLVSLVLGFFILGGCGGEGGDPTPAENSGPAAEFRAVAERLYSGDNRYLGTAGLDREKKRYLRRPIGAEERLKAGFAYIDELLKAGDVDRAGEVVEELEKHLTEHAQLRSEQSRFHRKAALVALRQAEWANCIQRANRDCCIFPPQGGGKHSVADHARRARTHLLALAAKDPKALDVRWLLNLVSQFLPEHPEGLPKEFRIDPRSWESDFKMERFRNVAAESGVDTFNLCGGAVVEDFDGDGHLDIATSSHDPKAPLTFYRGGKGLSFEDRTEMAGGVAQTGGLNLISGDYDRDGDIDLFVLRGAWLYDDGRIRNSLLRNDGSGRFEDVTHEAGLADPKSPTQAACWGDFNGDGHLDLYVVNESRRETGPPIGDFPAQLFMNRGDGSFEDRATEAGVTNDRYAKGVTTGDFDNDGDLDIYVSNIGRNRLYRNDGQGKFEDVAPELGVTSPADRSFACWFFDYDHDGWLDLFVAAYQSSLADIAADLLGQPHSGRSPCLYRNEKGRFRDVAKELDLDHPYLPMGAGFGDIDQDGWLDIYLATGDPEYETLTPNAMLRNDGGRRFQNVTTAGGFGHLQKGHGVAFGDLDNDGDQDIYHQLGGFYPGDRFRNALFENPATSASFLYLSLQDAAGGASVVGARITVAVETAKGRRLIRRAVGSVSSFGGAPYRQEIGLGDAKSITFVEVTWPGGERQRFEGLALRAAYRLMQGQAVPARLELP